MAAADRFKRAWNAFVQEGQTSPFSGTIENIGSPVVSPPPSRRGFIGPYNERSIINAIYTRLSIDVAEVIYKHVILDEQDRYLQDKDSRLNDCLTIEANIDQAPRTFRQDVAMTLLERGVCALVPVDTTVDPNTNQRIDILSLRVGEIMQWYPKHVRANVYNEVKGLRQELILPKSQLAIPYNPLYSIMNQPNSTMQRLIRKLTILDAIDEQAGSGKLDILIQLPFAVRTETKRQQAQQRREDIEFQLKDSQYGVAYIDSTERVTQLNRPAENNMLKQVEYLTAMLYGQLGLTPAIMDGTADEATMLNYYHRTIKPIVESIVEAMQMSFLGIAATRKKERIFYFSDPFRLVPLGQLADLFDKLERNEVISSNEARGIIGFPPHPDPKADELRNSNMPHPADGPSWEDVDQLINSTFDGISSDIDKFAAGEEPGGPTDGNG